MRYLWHGVTLFGMLLVFSSMSWANLGPFVMQYPAGDSATKGVIARLDPSLQPAREARLRVLNEDLTIELIAAPGYRHSSDAPLATVTAAYTIENPTGQEIVLDCGFPILRGIFSPPAMYPAPEVHINLKSVAGLPPGGPGAPPILNQEVPWTVISSATIYGIIRQQARATIEEAIAGNPELRRLIAVLREANHPPQAKQELLNYLTGKLHWRAQDAALLAEYPIMPVEQPVAEDPLPQLRYVQFRPEDARIFPAPSEYPIINLEDPELAKLATANLGPLQAMGEQKATQYLAQLATKLAPKKGMSYEQVFTAWGGDVRDRALDLPTGKVRPREMTLNATDPHAAEFDPTVYARVDYLDSQANITEAEKAACKTILQNLPVIFTYAPMNLLHFTVKFPAKSTQTLTVTYQQYTYLDTKAPSSYQLAYVVHPASLWKQFGPIHLQLTAPDGIAFHASVPTTRDDTRSKDARLSVYQGEVKDKTGELFIAVDAGEWNVKVIGPYRR